MHASPWAARLQEAWLHRGALARILWPLSVVFGVAVALRRAVLRVGRFAPRALPVPVVVVGNLVVGGAGKTPTVLALVALLRRHGWAPGIVSRGYGRATTDVREVLPGDSAADSGDEPLLLRIRGEVPVVVGTRRADAVRRLLDLHPGVDVVVSDDGLQHASLPRDLQVIVFDERGAGNGWLLPAGPLREPLAAATSDVRSWIIYNADRQTTPLAGSRIGRSLGGPVSLTEWWRGARAQVGDWQRLAGRPLVAAAGIARPERFFAMLRERGLQIEPLVLPDHHDWNRMPWRASTADVVVSEKDAVKLSAQSVGDARVWVAPLEFRLDGAFQSELLAELCRAADAKRRHPRHRPSEDRHGHSSA